MFSTEIPLFVLIPVIAIFLLVHWNISETAKASAVSKVAETFSRNTLEQRVQLLEILSELDSIRTTYGKNLHKEVYEAYVQRITEITSIEQLRELRATLPGVLSKVSSAKYTVRNMAEFIEMKHRSLL